MLKEFLSRVGLGESNVSSDSRLEHALFLTEQGVAQVKKDIAKYREKLDRETGADKLKKQNV